MNPFNDDKDILDNQVAILQYENGVRASFHTNCLSAIPERRMYICGTEGTLRADVIEGSLVVKRIGFDTETEDLATNVSGGHGGGDNIMGESLAKSILHGAKPLTSLEDGMISAFTAFGLDEAERSGEVFSLLPMWEKADI